MIFVCIHQSHITFLMQVMNHLKRNKLQSNGLLVFRELFTIFYSYNIKPNCHISTNTKLRVYSLPLKSQYYPGDRVQWPPRNMTLVFSGLSSRQPRVSGWFIFIRRQDDCYDDAWRMKMIGCCGGLIVCRWVEGSQNKKVSILRIGFVFILL